MALFRDGFGSQNFEDLKTHIKQGNTFLTDLSAVVRDRAKAEETYGHSLTELAKILQKKLQLCTGTVAAAWGRVATEMKAEGDVHTELGSTLKNDVVKSLDQLANVQKKERKAITQAEEVAKKEYNNKLTQETDRKREAFEASFKTEVDKDKEGGEAAGGSKKGWGSAKMLGKKKVIDDKYFDKWLTLEEGRQTWEAAVAKGCVQMQSLEEARISGLKDVLGRYISHLAGKVPRIQKFCDAMQEAAVSISAQSDIETFVKEKGVGSPTPEQRLLDCYAEMQSNRMDNGRRRDQLAFYRGKVEQEVVVEERAKEGVQKLVDVYQQRPQFAEEVAQEDARVRLVGIHQKLKLYEATLAKLQSGFAETNGQPAQTNPFNRYIGITHERVKDKYDIKNSILKIPLSEVTGGMGPAASRTAPEGSLGSEAIYARPHQASAASTASSSRFGSVSSASSSVRSHVPAKPPSPYNPAPSANPSLMAARANLPTVTPSYADRTSTYADAEDEFESNDDTCRALYPYTAQQSDELTIAQGEIILIRERHNDGWWEGEVNGNVGKFPSNYVEEC